MSYTPIFTDKTTIVEATGNQLDENDITDTMLKFGENRVTRFLRAKGIDYTELPGDDGTLEDWQNNTTLEEAATYSVLCRMYKIGVKGTTPVVGPVSSASADGMSKSFAGAGSVSRKDIESAFDWCEMAGNAMDNLVAEFRQTFGGAKKESPMIERKNKVYDRDSLQYKRFPF